MTTEKRSHQIAEEKNELIISYLTLRNLIGILGIALPVAVVIGSLCACGEWQYSISHYYYTNMGDWLVGILCAVSVFLFTYKGYETIDNIASTLAAICALGIAFFPTTPYHNDIPCCSMHRQLCDMSG